jgi:predicted PurR-regulated permease PerM
VVLGAVVVVQQVESNLLQPVVVGRAVALHPVAILMAVTAGAVVAGVIGAIVAVPMVAIAGRIAEHLRARAEAPRVPVADPGPDVADGTA